MRALEKALQYYTDRMCFDVLNLLISSTHFAQHHKVVGWSYVQDANTQDVSLFSLVTSELNHTMYVIPFFWDWDGKVVIWYLCICKLQCENLCVFFNSPAKGFVFVTCDLSILVKVYENRRQGTQSLTAGFYSGSVAQTLKHLRYCVLEQGTFSLLSGKR